MPLSQLNAEDLHHAVVTGCHHIIANQEQLNEINVFPVPDGDTGSNLSSTAKAVIELSNVRTDIKATLQSIAEASLIGARGNSGMIFSQFFTGWYQALNEGQPFTFQQFSDALGKASQSVRKAIASPTEGTILTLMESWANLVGQLGNNLNCFKDGLLNILPSLEEAVNATKTKLDVLKESDVVDAGALGFYHFVHGFTKYLHSPNSVKVQHQASPINSPSHEHDDEQQAPTLRYCTEAVIRGDQLNTDDLKRQLEQFGDSLVVSGTDTLHRFHVHTDKPHAVFSSLLEHGTLQYPKVDDMLRQYQMIHERKHNIALVMDSACDIPKELIEKYQIHILPVNLHLDEHDLLDGYSFDSDHFYQTLSELKSYPKTSLPTKSMVESKLKQIADHYDDVLIITLAQALSGTHDVIKSVSNEYKNIHVIDSKNTTAGIGLIVQSAGELIESGQSIDEVIKAVDSFIDRATIYVAIEQFDSLVRSGRISSFKARIGQFTGIKPIISLDKNGKGQMFGKALSTPKAQAKLISYVEELCQKENLSIQKYAITHAGVEKKAQSFAKLTEEAFGKPPEFIEPVATAIGLHAGLGAVSLAVLLG